MARALILQQMRIGYTIGCEVQNLVEYSTVVEILNEIIFNEYWK